MLRAGCFCCCTMQKRFRHTQYPDQGFMCCSAAQMHDMQAATMHQPQAAANTSTNNKTHTKLHQSLVLIYSRTSGSLYSDAVAPHTHAHSPWHAMSPCHVVLVRWSTHCISLNLLNHPSEPTSLVCVHCCIIAAHASKQTQQQNQPACNLHVPAACVQHTSAADRLYTLHMLQTCRDSSTAA